MNSTMVTWLGHASFRIDSPGGKRVYVDPWLGDNPACPSPEWEAERADIIAVTHGHFDHNSTDVVALAQTHGSAIVAQYEVVEWLRRQGVAIPESNPGMNKGGTIIVDGISFTMTHAVHSSGVMVGDTIMYCGDAAGFVITLEDGLKLYFAGDTNVFSDMALIRELYAPDIAVLPIGNVMTMGPREAAVALRLLGTKRCIPCHFGTVPFLTGFPDELRALAPGVEILELNPGETVAVDP